MLLELAAAAALLACLFVWLATESGAWQRYYRKQQVRTAAQALAADLREVQQKAYFLQNSSTRALRVYDNINNAYCITSGTLSSTLERAVYFSDIGCEDVYFSQKITKVTFSSGGAPSTNGAYILRHKQLADFSCRLLLQPVTGRVSVYEEK